MSTRTTPYPLPPDTDRLLAVAWAVAWELERKRKQLGINCFEEESLHRSRALADFNIDRYLTFAAAADQSLEEQIFLGEVKARCYRSLERLRWRVTRSLAALCRIMNDKQLEAVARHVIAVGA